jgi:hypothetical protein
MIGREMIFAPVKAFFRNLADVLDGLAFIACFGAVWLFMSNLATVKTGPEFMQIGLLTLAIAIVPYCLAGAAHRIWSRFA